MSFESRNIGLDKIFPQSGHQIEVEKYVPSESGLAVQASSVKPIIICFTNRSGSTLVSEQLATSGYAAWEGINVNYEHFNSDHIIQSVKNNNLKSVHDYAHFCANKYVSENGFFLTKVSIDQLTWLSRIGVIGAILTDPIFIDVRRGNVIAQAISVDIALQTGEWTSLHPKSSIHPTFNPVFLTEIVREILFAQGLFDLFFNISGYKRSHVLYEDIVHRPDIVSCLLRDKASFDCEANSKSPTRTVRLGRQSGSLNHAWEEKYRAWARDQMAPNALSHLAEPL